MSRSMTSEAAHAVTTLQWIAVLLGIALLVTFIALCVCCCRQRGSSGADTPSGLAALHDNLLRREQLEDENAASADGDSNTWQCIVCAHTNAATRKTCLMCGTSVRFLLTADTTKPGLVRHMSSQTLLRTESVDDMEEELHARQRALFKRRLNYINDRKNLSQRQRGAFRRRLWERKQLADGKFHWIRQSSRDDVTAVLPEDASSEKSSVLAGPHGENVVDFHQLRSQGFVWQYDERGQLQWTKADEVSIDMDSFQALQQLGRSSRRKGEVLDYEGVMALEFRLKKQWFLVQLAQMATPIHEAVSKMTIRRDHLLHDSVSNLVTASPEALHMYLKVSFEGEAGIDAGGLLREWFVLVTKELFSEERGLFLPTKGENMSYWINPLSKEKCPNHLQYFRLAGLLVGKAMFEGLVLDVHLALPLLKHILGVPISFSDLEFLDDELYRNCQWLRNNSNAEALCLTFSILLENGEEVDLKPNGRSIDVTDENKEEYLRLVLKHRMLGSISEQLQEFLTGIYDVVPKTLLSVYDYQELELFLCGIPTIDITDWKANSRVRYISDEDVPFFAIKRSDQDNIVSWFWVAVENLSPEERAKLLQFTTGTSRVPVEGFKGLTSSSGIIHPFTIQIIRRGNKPSDLFPKAHTCFNRLELPLYKDLTELENYLSMVIQMEIVGFGLE